MQGVLINAHLTGEQRGLPALGEIQRHQQEVSDQREDQKTHHPDGDVTPHQKDQIQRQHDAQADQHPHGHVYRDMLRQLLSQRVSDRHGIDLHYYKKGDKVERGDQIADLFPVVVRHRTGDPFAAFRFR